MEPVQAKPLASMKPTPTPNYDPNELVTLVGSKGTVKQVKRADLPQYDLPTDYISQADTYAKQIMNGNVAADSPNIPAEYRAGALQVLQRNKFTPESKNELDLKQKSTEAKKVIGDTASEVLDVIHKGETGQLDPNSQEYKDDLGYAASDYNKRGFTEAGKSIVGKEQGIIQGTQIQVNPVGPNGFQRIGEFATGEQVTPKSKVVDPNDSIKTKMVAAIEAAGGKVPDWLQKGATKQETAKGLGDLLGLKPGTAPNKIATGAVNDLLGFGQQIIDSGGGPGINPLDPIGSIKEKVQSGENTLQGIGQTVADVTKNPVEYAINHPINTALAVGGLTEGGVDAVKGTPLPEIAPEAAAPVAESTALPKVKGVGVQDFLHGAGSKEYIARQATSDTAIPQNQVLQEEGILKHPAGVERIKATSRSLQKFGSSLGNLYKNSKEVVTGDHLDSILTDGLQKEGVPTADAKKIVQRVTQDIKDQGIYDPKGNVINMEQLWNGAKYLEKYNPIIKGDADATAYLKNNSGTLARLMRDELKSRVKESVPYSARYSALKDFMDKVLKTPEGVKIKGSPFSWPGQAVGGLEQLISAGVNHASGAKPLPAIEAAPSAQMSTLPSIEATGPETTFREKTPKSPQRASIKYVLNKKTGNLVKIRK